MKNYILVLILLIAISCGILYICVQKTREPLDTFSSQCLKGCRPPKTITGNCRPVYKKNNAIIYSCPQECGTNNLSQKRDTCSYDEDCKSCKKTLMDSKGRPLIPRNKPGPPGQRPLPLAPPAPARSFRTGTPSSSRTNTRPTPFSWTNPKSPTLQYYMLGERCTQQSSSCFHSFTR